MNALATSRSRVLVFGLRCSVLVRCVVLIDGRPGTDSQIVLSRKALQAIHTCG
jgi:hypothetical protein